MDKKTIAISCLIFVIVLYSALQHHLLMGILMAVMILVAIKQIPIAQKKFKNVWYTPEKRVIKKESISDKILYALVLLSRLPYLKEDDTLGFRLCILTGFLDIVGIISSIAWIIYSSMIGTGINIIGYLLGFAFVSLVFTMYIYYFHVKAYKLIAFSTIILIFILRTIYKSLPSIIVWNWG